MVLCCCSIYIMFYAIMIDTACQNLDEIRILNLRFIEGRMILGSPEEGFYVC